MGIKPIIVWGFIFSALAVIVQATAIAVGSSVLLFVGFVALGVVGAAADVAINVSGAAL